MAGSLGDAGIFSFYPNKQITTGEGGMIVSNDAALASLWRSLRNQGRDDGSEWSDHERLGYNYRLSDLNCALGLAQLMRINEILERRDRVSQMYAERLQQIPQVTVPYVAPHVKVSWFVYVIRLSEDYTSEDRRRILLELRQRGIGCSDYFKPIHLQPFYRELFGYQEGDFPVAEAIASRTIALPFYGELTEPEVEHVVSQLRALL